MLNGGMLMDMNTNAEIKSAVIAFKTKGYIEHTLEELESFYEKHAGYNSTRCILRQLISALKDTKPVIEIEIENE